MLAYIIRRLFILPLVIFGLFLMVFGMMSLLDPYQKAAVFISDPVQLKNQDIDVLVRKFGLDDPPWTQFWHWFTNVLQGDLGWSETAKRPVVQAFMRFWPQSAELAIWAALPIILGGIWLGVLSAVKQNQLLDHLSRIFAVVGWSLPTFVAGLLALFLLYGIVPWFPPGRLGLEASRIVHSPEFHPYTGMMTFDAILNGNGFVFIDALRHLVLPVITLAYVQWAILLRVTRSSMLETLRQEYVQAARAKGLKEKVVIKKHARRNALIPVSTIAGIIVALLFNGLVITEYIFDLHGLGRWSVMAAQQFDLPAILAYLLFNGFLIVVANLTVDIFYAYIDPRVRLE